MAASLLLIGSTVIASVLLTGIYRFMAIRYSWLAIPEGRSSHSSSVPRSAGFVILLLGSVYILYQFFLDAINSCELLVLIIPATIGIVGLIDDAVALSSKLRFAIYASLITMLVLSFSPITPIDVFGLSIQASWSLIVIYVFAITWLVNLFNFMDGINGIAGGQFLFVVIAGLCLLPITASPELNLVLVIAAAVIGFLVWNFPSGKVFMGDAGSTFLAATLGWLVMFSVEHYQASPWTWVILSACFVADTSYTLIVRIITGQPWAEAHSSHCYQILARRWLSHSKTVYTIMLINIFWLWPLAWLATRYHDYEFAIVIIAYVPLTVGCFSLGAGKAQIPDKTAIH